MITVDELMTKFSAARAKYAEEEEEPVPPPTFDELAAHARSQMGRPLRPGEGFQTAETHPVSLAQTRTSEGDINQPYDVVAPRLWSWASFVPSAMNPYVRGSIFSGGPATVGDAAAGAVLGYNAARYWAPSAMIARDPRSYPPGTPVNAMRLGNMTEGAAARFVEPMVRGNPAAVAIQPASGAPIPIQTQPGKGQPPMTRNQIAANTVGAARKDGISTAGSPGLNTDRASLITQRPPTEGPITAVKNLPGIRPREIITLPQGDANLREGNWRQRLRAAKQVPGPRAGAGKFAPLGAAAAGFALPGLYNWLYGSKHLTEDGPQTSVLPTIIKGSGEIERPAGSMLNPVNWFR